MTPTLPFPLRLLVRVFERILAIYPPAFRARFGDAMTAVYRDALRDRLDTSGGLRALAFGLRGLLNLVAGGIAERRVDRERRRAPLAPRATRWPGLRLQSLAQDVRFATRRLRRCLSTLVVGIFSVSASGSGSPTAPRSVESSKPPTLWARKACPSRARPSIRGT